MMSDILMKSNKSEKGQSLLLVVASMFAIMALLALTLDGGFALMRRRDAQNAADSGALAGARALCVTGDPSWAEDVAESYAVSYNSATSAKAVSFEGIVTVDAVAQYDSFFAGIFGISQIDVAAHAAAGCFSPGFGMGTLPVAWSCNPPIDEATGTPTAAYTFADCEVKSISPSILALRQGDTADTLWNFHHTWYPEMYVIMDSEKIPEDIVCLPEEGGINCNLDGSADGSNDLLADGDRSWLDLDGGGGGSNELVDWIDGSEVIELEIHWWLPGQEGLQNNVFMAAATRVGDIVMVPVFDAICEQNPDNTPTCYDLPHSPYDNQDTVVVDGGTFTSYFHIIGFAAFYISCVYTGGSGSCPGQALAADLGVIADNAKSVEGYFITQGFVQGIGGQPSDGVDAGIYTVYLTE